MTRPLRTPELVAKAKEMRARGLAYAAIGNVLGVSQTAIMRWCDPERAALYNERSRIWRQDYRRPVAAISYANRNPIPDTELARRLRRIPLDTRTDGEKLLGTPLPGRSALDRKQRGVRES